MQTVTVTELRTAERRRARRIRTAILGVCLVLSLAALAYSVWGPL